MVIETKVVIGWFKLQLFLYEWLIELSDNNLTSELVKIGVFFKPITIEEIVIFMIREVKVVRKR